MGDINETLAFEDELRAEIERGVKTLPLLEFLAHVVREIMVRGWLSRNQAWMEGREGAATADFAWSTCMSTPHTSTQRLEEARLKPDHEDVLEAEACLSWLADHLYEVEQHTPLTEYQATLKAMMRLGVVTLRTCGIAASIVFVASRARAKALEDRLRGDHESQWIAPIRSRVTNVSVTCTSIYPKDQPEYGVSYCHTFVTDAGDILTWWTGRVNYQPGECAVIDATVKGHNTYEGQRQTNISYVRPSE